MSESTARKPARNAKKGTSEAPKHKKYEPAFVAQMRQVAQLERNLANDTFEFYLSERVESVEIRRAKLEAKKAAKAARQTA